ncbi:hypothetical protein, partial [Chloroflexus sp.]|uniref:hypothetical protein n=1 Tax=Chloroflexus sp. TaxID=1904827 RepID=UPI002ACDEE57
PPKWVPRRGAIIGTPHGGAAPGRCRRAVDDGHATGRATAEMGAPARRRLATYMSPDPVQP